MMREIHTSKVVGYFGVRKINENPTLHIHQKVKRLGFKGEFHWLCVQTRAFSHMVVGVSYHGAYVRAVVVPVWLRCVHLGWALCVDEMI